MIRRTAVRHSLSLLTVAAALLTTSATALADTLTSGGDAELVERSHEITLDLDDHKLARATVHRVFENTSETADELVLDIELAEDAAVTALRMRDPDTGQWHDATLESADLADAVYHDPGVTNARARRAALLSWQTPGRLRLELTPVPALDVVEIEYDLVVPTDYADGHHRLHWSFAPDPDADTLAVPTIRWARPLRGLQVAAATDAGLEASDTRRPVDGPVELTDALIFEVPAAGVDTLDVRLARVDVRDGLTFVQVGLDIAPQLAPMPEGATVVLLVDASYSMGTDGVEAQLAIARSMVNQLPDAHVQLVAYRRVAERLFDHPVRGREFAAALDAAVERGAFGLANGSALELALAEAVDIVARREAGTPARIVAMSDELLRPSWSNQAVLEQTLASLDPETVLHVVQPGEGYREVVDTRVDDAMLAPLALAHGGVRVDVDVALDSDAFDADTLARATLGLIRPTHVDNLELVGIEAAPFDTGLPERLDEGDGWQAQATLLDAPVDGPVVLRGELWSTPLERTMTREADLDRAFAGHLAVSNTGQLADEDIHTLATLGHVVSEQTSLRVEIQVGRYEARMWGGGFGFGMSGCGGGGCGSSSRCGGIRAAEVELDVREMLEPALAACLTHSELSEADLQGDIEINFDTTHDEIVDVMAQVADGAGPASEALASCLVEKTWATRLDSRFHGKIKRYTAAF